MLTRETPLSWRRGFALYRRRLSADSWGNPIAVYRMDAPDFTAADGSADGICWQNVRAWQSSGRLTSGASSGEAGEQYADVLEGYLFSPLALSAFDRILLDGALYEIRAIQHWPDYRKLLAQRLGGEEAA